MTSRFSRRAWTVAVALSLVAMAACTGGDESQEGQQEEVTLDFWTYGEGQNSPYGNAMAEAFEAGHPNIHIDYTYYPAENYNVKVNTAIAAGKAPDLILAFDLNLLIEGKLLPLDDLVAERGFDLSTFNQGIIEGPGEFSCSWEGHLYCWHRTRAAGGSSTTRTCSTRRGCPTRRPGRR
jgi:ABC-type glycerol-3-phosphate transport system substrate-binding protein